MDIEAHIAVALALSALFLRAGGWKPAAMVTLASILPDLDYYLFLTDPLASIVRYGTYGHSLLLTPLLAALAVLPFGRPSYTIKNYAVCLIAALLHLGIDITSTHGVHVLLPFSSQRFHLDLIPDNDAVLIAIPIIGLAVGLLFDAVVLRAESAQARKGGAAWSAIALLCVAAYLAQRWSAHEQVVRLANRIEFTYRDEDPERIEVLPVSLYRWRCVALGERFVGEVEIERLFGALPLPQFLPRQNPSPAFAAAKTTREIQALSNFAEAPFWKFHLENGATRVDLIDLRSGPLARPAYRASALIAPTGAAAQSSFTIDRPSWHIRDGMLLRD